MGIFQYGRRNSQRESSCRGCALTHRSAVLWLTHVWSPELDTEFQRLLQLDADVWLLLDRQTPHAAAIAARYPRCHIFDEHQLFALPYPRLAGHGLINHPHFPLLDFFSAHDKYDRYWVIEYDVRYSGEWSHFFGSVDSYEFDMMTCHARRYALEPWWPWWKSLEHPSRTMTRDQLVRSFNPIYGVSRAALVFLHAALLDGWKGYPEVTVPTLLLAGGFRLLDLGGHGEFTPPALRNQSYTSSATTSGYLSPFGTMRYRPARSAVGNLPNKLYHPVKPRHLVEPWPQKVKRAAIWAKELMAQRWRSANIRRQFRR